MDQDETEINLHQTLANRLTSIVRTEFESILRDEVDIHSEGAMKRRQIDGEIISLQQSGFNRVGFVVSLKISINF